MIGGLSKAERTVLLSFFQATLEFNQSLIEQRRGATPRGPDRLLAATEIKMVEVSKAALSAFGEGK